MGSVGGPVGETRNQGFCFGWRCILDIQEELSRIRKQLSDRKGN